MTAVRRIARSCLGGAARLNLRSSKPFDCSNHRHHRAAMPSISTSSLPPNQYHYQAHTSDTYEDAYFYEPGQYTSNLCQKVQHRLALKDNLAMEHGAFRTLLDVGGGTGNFTSMILEDTTNSRAIVVDPYLIDDATVERSSGKLRFLKAPAEDFMLPVEEGSRWWRTGYHQVLLKEVVHHFDETNRVGIFRGIGQGLEPLAKAEVPSLLVITRPQHDIDYPLWNEARHVWAQNQPALETLVQELREAEFTNVAHTVETHPCSIALDRWQSMVKGRFWSTFSNFTDAELEQACEIIANDERHRIDPDGILHFQDRLLFISACKPATEK